MQFFALPKLWGLAVAEFEEDATAANALEGFSRLGRETPASDSDPMRSISRRLSLSGPKDSTSRNSCRHAFLRWEVRAGEGRDVHIRGQLVP